MRLVATLAPAIATLGCWQEVHYESPSADTLPPAHDASVVESPRSPTELDTSVSDQRTAIASPGSRSKDAVQKSDVPASLPEPLASKPPAFKPPASNPRSVEAANPEGKDLPFVADKEIGLETSRMAAWLMSSQWSMAAALQAKNKGMDVYGSHLEQARAAAARLRIKLPELPSHANETGRVTKTLGYLMETAGPQLMADVDKIHGADRAALTELAIKTHTLLLSYTPNTTGVEPVIAAITRSALESDLPAEVWGDLVNLLGERADFVTVKAAIFDLHRRADAYLAAQLRR